MDDAVIETVSGAVRGVRSGECAAYRAIPYAAPIAGAARFLPPQPPTSWSGIRDATTFGASVPQPTIWAPGDDPESLTVNVWTSYPPKAAAPVLVWLHGGACMHGTAATSDFDGAALARSGAVVVTVNYRVGYEGFGWVDDAPCNRGVLDQIAALEWVRDNIARFGGSPENVTLFGQSAGASAILALTAGRRAEGMFGRGIAQSPGRIFVPADEARTVSTMITDELGIRPTVADLEDVPSDAIHAVQQRPVATMHAEPGRWTLPDAPYSIIIDGDLLDATPWVQMRSSSPTTDLLCGYTRDEARMFTADLDLSGIDPAGTALTVGLPSGAASRYRDTYPGITDNDLNSLILSDSLFRITALRAAEAHADTSGRTYLYEFAWPSPAHEGRLGACHGLDVPFTFGNPTSELGTALIGPTVPADFTALSARIREAVLSFARGGDPGWPQFDTAQRIARVWRTPPSTVHDPIAASRTVWESALR